ncbi:hypothetical protein AMECASPLE_033544 [Ameca splendens]|uniref:Secreted protein n=1 Tax=Ameca splendens TaxID=208324 RepID=A0ABV0YTV2_9TELE
MQSLLSASLLWEIHALLKPCSSFHVIMLSRLCPNASLSICEHVSVYACVSSPSASVALFVTFSQTSPHRLASHHWYFFDIMTFFDKTIPDHNLQQLPWLTV